MGDSYGTSEDQNAIGMQSIKTVLVMLQMEMRTLLEIGLEAIHVMCWQRTWLHLRMP
jgi:hypothetical protein